MPTKFLLLEPGPVAPDEPHQRGDSHLLEALGLGKIATVVLSGRMAPADYQSKVLCLADWRRQGTAYDLAPLAQQFPSSARPEFKPLSKEAFDRAFALQPGGCRLSENEKGDLLQTNLGGFGAPSQTVGSGQPSASVGMGAAAGGAAPPVTKIKLKVKTDKKRRREEGGEQAG